METESVEGRKCWQALPLCLERENDVILVLKGNGHIPQNMHPRRRVPLKTILEASQDGGTEVPLEHLVYSEVAMLDRLSSS